MEKEIREFVIYLHDVKKTSENTELSYKRDLQKGLNPDIPLNYYPENNPEKTPVLSWRSGSNCIYSNWLNFVYQETPYRLEELRPVSEDSYLREDHWSERDSTVSLG